MNTHDISFRVLMDAAKGNASERQMEAAQVLLAQRPRTVNDQLDIDPEPTPEGNTA